ncbi:MAG TPA: TetR/AcrR family transcriptional regulator [Phototrophicaceae bacterium]|jgi:AcrR family transcriptional regulator|nr:TetR/AcrR family transcriptional regulator [Phototrophicaceae bacterium]
MPYPAKTSAQTILTTAMDYLEEYGEEALSMRELAGKLDLSPRALYRYYPERAILEAAIAAEGFRRLRVVLVETVGTRQGKEALRGIAEGYLNFAQANPKLYPLLVRFHEHTPEFQEAANEVWGLVVGAVAEAVDSSISPDAAAVALWAFLHGFVQLDNAAIIGERKPRSGFTIGLEAFLTGLGEKVQSE